MPESMFALGPVPRPTSDSREQLSMSQETDANQITAAELPPRQNRRRPASARPHRTATSSAALDTSKTQPVAGAAAISSPAASRLEDMRFAKVGRPSSAHAHQVPAAKMINPGPGLVAPNAAQPSMACTHQQPEQQQQQQEQQQQQQQTHGHAAAAIHTVCYQPAGLQEPPSGHIPLAVQQLVLLEQEQQQVVQQCAPIVHCSRAHAHARAAAGQHEIQTANLSSSSSKQLDTIAEEHCEAPSCPAVDLAMDVSFSGASYAGSGRSSPSSMLAHHRPHSSFAGSWQQQQQQQQWRRHLGQQRAESAHAYSQQRCQADKCGSLKTGPAVVEAPRPWFAAAPYSARRLFGRQALQTQRQLVKSAGAAAGPCSRSAQPYYTYSIDRRLMARSSGQFSPSSLGQVTRGAGFHMLPGSLPRCSNGAVLLQHQQHKQLQQQHTSSPAAAPSLVACKTVPRPRSAGPAACSASRRPCSATANARNASGICRRVPANALGQELLGQDEHLPSSPDGVDETSTAETAAVGVSTASAAQTAAVWTMPVEQLVARLTPSGSGASIPGGFGDDGFAAAAAAAQATRPWSASSAQFRLAATAPLPAAAVAAVKLREKQQECLSAAKAAAKLNAPMCLDYSATARGQVASNFGSRSHQKEAGGRRVYSSKPNGTL